MVDSDLPLVKQEAPGPEEVGEENKEDYVSESTPAEEIGGVGTPVVSAGMCPPYPDFALSPPIILTHDVNSSSDHGDFQPGWNPPPGCRSLVAKVCPIQLGVGMVEC